MPATILMRVIIYSFSSFAANTMSAADSGPHPSVRWFILILAFDSVAGI
jgi:hypothetical protein